jgi:hypothetical protein
MFTKSKVAIFAAFVLAAASQALAKDASIPNIDLEKLCRAAEGATSDIYGTATTNEFESCMTDEKSAREQLVKDWATFSASDKELCLQPMDYLPSYVEWLTCAELQRDARKMRNEQPASTPPTPSTRSQSPG